MINFTKSKKENNYLEITVSPACPKLCDYCPQTAYITNYKKKFSNEDKVLKLDTIKQISKNVIIKLIKKNIDFSIFLIGEDFHPLIQNTINNLVDKFDLSDKVIKAKYLNTRASSIDPNKFGLKQTTKKNSENGGYFCSYQRLNQGVLLPNGKVAMCCQDYGLETIIGDLKIQSIDEIYTSIENDKNWRNKFINGTFSPCNKCEHYSPVNREITNKRIN